MEVQPHMHDKTPSELRESESTSESIVIQFTNPSVLLVGFTAWQRTRSLNRQRTIVSTGCHHKIATTQPLTSAAKFGLDAGDLRAVLWKLKHPISAKLKEKRIITLYYRRYSCQAPSSKIRGSR
ncbi:hypothetical protein INR49_004465 [Caranx melampygus]|nr:hypothetical protein INR49_004465 [Caranx melampygus]